MVLLDELNWLAMHRWYEVAERREVTGMHLMARQAG